MLSDWVLDEMKTANLEDKRLDKRLRMVLSQLAEHPTASIPAACGGNAEMTAAYRLFDNEKATFERILEAHAEATQERIGVQPVVVLVQDSTEIDLTRPTRAVLGAGPLDGGARAGALLHVMHAFTPDGTPLGTTHAVAWTRGAGSTCAELSRGERWATPLHEKESQRWVTALEAAQGIAAHSPATQCICVADSEADIYEMFVTGTAQGTSIDWVVRAAQDRAVRCNNGDLARLRDELLAGDVRFTQRIQVRGRDTKVSCEARGRRQARESREAIVEVRATQVTLRPPRRPDGKLPEVTVNAVLVHESSPPAGEIAVEWLLVTSLPIHDAEEVRRVIQLYSVRWMIEVFFRVLKSGCRVEERRFQELDRLLTCLAVYLIVAWRALYVCRLGRSCPDIPCDAVFEPAEWKAVWKVVRGEDPPSTPPPLGTMVRIVAQLGGYINRKRTDPPGPQTLWIGLQRMHDFALCWQMFGPETRNQHFELV
jgi:hypothetical protein